MKNRLILSVIVPTYNHELFIASCLDSIINQVTNFDFLILVGDDFSNDRTVEIIKRYSKRHPDKIKLYLRKKNLGNGGKDNALLLYRECNSKYIAYLDGDDRMLPGKLQKQVDFMESNPNYSMCGHNVRVFDSQSNKTLKLYNTNLRIHHGTINDLIIHGTYIANQSIMYRTKYLNLDIFNNLFSYKYQGDLLFQLIIAKKGPIGYIDEVLGEYRKHSESITGEIANSIDKYRIFIEERLDIIEKSRFFGIDDSIINIGKQKTLIGSSLYLLNFGNYELFRKYCDQAFVLLPPRGIKHWIIYVLRHFPFILRTILKFKLSI